jgi:uncharacterized protein
MLIRFSVKNFRSFDEEVLFSLIPGRSQKHQHHVQQQHSVDFKVLRMALLYGANASGKSNLVRAMEFARDLILEGTRPKQLIDVQPFRLRAKSDDTPSRFEFEFIAGGKAYAYGFIIDRRKVHEEWLYNIHLESDQEDVIFERTTSREGMTQATFTETFAANLDEQFLHFVARGTRPNQLLFTELIENNVSYLDPIDRWFRHSLTIIFPHSHFNGIEINVHADQEFSQALAQFLHSLHTGIDEVRLQRVEIESLDLPQELIEKVSTELEEVEQPENETPQEIIVVLEAPGQRRFMLQRTSDSGIESYSLATVRHFDGSEVVFEVSEESDGTQRLFDLFPVLHSSEEKVFVIDELERSLHPNLVHRFIETFLGSKGNNQLIVTTHESTLLDLSLLRRDEIWFVEKSPRGASTLYSLEEFKIRHDLDIRKGYLQGRFGAIPVFGSSLIREDQEE